MGSQRVGHAERLSTCSANQSNCLVPCRDRVSTIPDPASVTSRPLDPQHLMLGFHLNPCSLRFLSTLPVPLQHLTDCVFPHSNMAIYLIPFTSAQNKIPEVSGCLLERMGLFVERSTMLVSLVAHREKDLPAMMETWVQSLGWEDPLEKGMAAHSSILAWKTPWTEEPWQAPLPVVTESYTTEQLTLSLSHDYSMETLQCGPHSSANLNSFHTTAHLPHIAT